MNWFSLFTEYDPSIAVDANRDPLGLQVIWSAVGQEIFGRSITSISTDIRNFTVNLLHHYFIGEISSLYGFSLPEKYIPLFSTVEDISFKTGGVIFLENLFALTACSFPDRIQTTGILGSSVAFRRLDKFKKDEIQLEWNVKNGLLVRQIGLGINGRYKTPFIQAGIMDRWYRYSKLKPVWEEIRVLVEEWKGAKNLLERFSNICSDAFSIKKEHPGLTLGYIFDNYPELSELYAECLGEAGRIPEQVRQFWKKHLHLTGGASGALYEAIGKFGEQADNNELVVKAALQKISSPEERKKLEHITEVEPFLSSVAFLFDALLCRSVFSRCREKITFF